MALLKCPDCGKDVSDKAAACLNCGCPVDAMERDAAQSPVDDVASVEMREREDEEAAARESEVKEMFENTLKQRDEVSFQGASLAYDKLDKLDKKASKVSKIIIALIIVAALAFVGYNQYNLYTLRQSRVEIIRSNIESSLFKYGVTNIAVNIKDDQKDTYNYRDTRLYKCEASASGFDVVSNEDKAFIFSLYFKSQALDEKKIEIFKYEIMQIESSGKTYSYKEYGKDKGLYENGNLIYQRPETPVDSSPSSNTRYYSSSGVSSSDKTYAYTAAKIAVEEQLKSPSTAKFPWPDEITVEKDGSYFRIKGYVDAQNEFGATVRNDFTVEIEKVSSEKFNIVAVAVY